MITIKHLVRRPGRSISTAAGVCLGALTYMVLVAAGRGLVEQFHDSAKLLGAELVVHEKDVTSPWGSWLPESLADDLSAIESVRWASPVALGKTRLKETDYFLVFGVRSNHPSFLTLPVSSGAGLPSDTARHHLLIGAQAGRRLELEVGDRLQIRGFQFLVSGTYQSGKSVLDNGAIIDLKTTQQLFNLRDGVNMIFLDLDEEADPEVIAGAITSRYPGTTAMPTARWVDSYGQGALAELFARFLGLIAIIIATLSLANVMQISINERLRELAILRAVGWSRWRVFRLVLGESLLLTIAGGVAAIPVSMALLMLFSRIDPAILNTAGILPPTLPWTVAAEGLIVAVLAGSAGSAAALARVARMDPAKALRAL